MDSIIIFQVSYTRATFVAIAALLTLSLGWLFFSNLQVNQNQSQGQNQNQSVINNTPGNESTLNTIQISGYQQYSVEKLSNAGEITVILFFKANWCPSCLALDRDIKQNIDSIPDNILILEVPYDKASGASDEELDLGRRNGVTYQHTLMVVDNKGNKTRDLVSASRLSQLLADLES